MISHRVLTPRSEQLSLQPKLSADRLSPNRDRRRRDVQNQQGSSSLGNGRLSPSMVFLLGLLGCLSLITQVAFIIYVSSMTFSRLESAIYAPHKKKFHPPKPEKVKPRVFGYYYRNVSSLTYLGSERLNPNMHRRPTRTIIEFSKEDWKRQRHLEDSEDYLEEQKDPLEDGDCVAQFEWQKASFPNCNLLHELDMTASLSAEDNVRILSLSGFWRDVWLVNFTARNEQLVLKTLAMKHEVSERNFDRHRRDTLAMDRLTPSPNIVNVFGFCGNSGITEFADGGSLESVIFRSPNATGAWTMSEKIVVAYQIATALADAHNVNKVGQASIAHTDITPANFVYLSKKGRYVLNDFNRCRLITWNKKLNKTCSFLVGNNPGTFRSPEEYAYKEETEKIDVYSLGNVYYALLTSQWPFENDKDEIAQRKIARGRRPAIDQAILASKDPITQTFVQVIDLCWKQDPVERPSASEVENFLGLQLLRLGMAKGTGGELP